MKSKFSPSPKLALVVVLGVLGALSLVLNVIFFEQGSAYFRELAAVRLDPLGLEAHVAEIVPPLQPKQRRVVFLGDSRAMMWPSPTTLPDFQFINRGVSQQTTAQIRARFEQEIPPLHPDVVVMELGVNDLKEIPLFPERSRAITETVEANIRALVGRVHDLGATAVLVTVFPLGPIKLTRRPFWSDDVAHSIDAVNHSIDGLTDARTVILRADAALVDPASNAIKPGFALDMLHLTGPAYSALNENKLVPLLRALHP